MMRVNLLCVGRCKERYLQQGCAEYAKRLQAFCKLNVIELPEERLHDSIDEGIRGEGDRLLAKMSGSYAIALCVEGRQMSSPAFAELLSGLPLSGHSSLDLVIGGSYGLDERVKAACQLRLSVSEMTFPHQLFRVMLLEQLYRAFCIGGNIKYHK